MDKLTPPTIIPALPGFWLHLICETDTGLEDYCPRMAVVAWLLEPSFQLMDWHAAATPITADGTTTQEYFIEQPDGSCISIDFSVKTVRDAWLEVERLVAERIAHRAKQTA